MTHSCLWCPTPLPAERGRGSARRFCSTDCRQAFHTAARRHALAEIEAGRLTVARLKECAHKSVHAFSRGHLASAGSPVASQDARNRPGVSPPVRNSGLEVGEVAPEEVARLSSVRAA